MDNSGYYAVIPANVRYDKRLKPNAKLLYGELTALTGKEGFCWAKNEYFAELYDVHSNTISSWISLLHELGYIEIEWFKNDNTRKIYIANLVKKTAKKLPLAVNEKTNTYSQKDEHLLTKRGTPVNEKRDSYIRMNNTINNTINREENALAFFVNNCPSKWDLFRMKFKSQISDFKIFCELFNAKFETEKLEFDANVISGRLTTFAIHFIQNEKKNVKPNFANANIDLPINHHSRRKLD